jgi:plastocyanin
VVVYLKEVNGNKGFSAPKGGPSMASEDMKFTPEILPILVGTSVVFPNKDDTIHNAFSISDAKKFDLGRYGYGEENSVHFDKPGSVFVYCKIHPHMTGYILVLENPYFTLTDGKGNYSIPNVPAGNYTVVSWFPFGDSQTKKVDLTQDTKARADFSLVKLRSSNPRKSLVAEK